MTPDRGPGGPVQPVSGDASARTCLRRPGTSAHLLRSTARSTRPGLAAPKDLSTTRARTRAGPVVKEPRHAPMEPICAGPCSPWLPGSPWGCWAPRRSRGSACSASSTGLRGRGGAGLRRVRARRLSAIPRAVSRLRGLADPARAVRAGRGRAGGGDVAVFRAVGMPCLLAGVALGAVLAASLLARRAGRGTVATVVCLCAVNPITLRALDIGHPEELLGAALCAGAVLAALRGRSTLAGVLLGLALTNKAWALLAVGTRDARVAGRSPARARDRRRDRRGVPGAGPARRRVSGHPGAAATRARSSSPGRCGGSSARRVR